MQKSNTDIFWKHHGYRNKGAVGLAAWIKRTWVPEPALARLPAFDTIEVRQKESSITAPGFEDWSYPSWLPSGGIITIRPLLLRKQTPIYLSRSEQTRNARLTQG